MKRKNALRRSRELATRILSAHFLGNTPVLDAFHLVVELELDPEPEDAGNRGPASTEALRRTARLVETTLERWHRLLEIGKKSGALAVLSERKAPSLAAFALFVHLADALYLLEPPVLPYPLLDSIHRIVRVHAGRKAAQAANLALKQALDHLGPADSRSPRTTA